MMPGDRLASGNSPKEAVEPVRAAPIPARAALVEREAVGTPREASLPALLLRSTTFVIGAVILTFWIFDAAFWPAIVPQDPQALNPGATLQGPSAAHWLGTDDLGRDILSRTLAGASSVLLVAPAATALGLAGGVSLGLVTGYYRGLVDDVLMRIVDALLAFPLIIIAVLVLAVLGHSVVNLILVIGAIFTPIVARTARAAVLAEREREYVAAAKLIGNSSVYIMAVEILPNIAAPITVEATIRLGYAIFTSATLSFLSLGIQQPSPDWGLTISLGRPYLQVAPWVVLAPAAALASLVVAVNLVADGLGEALEA
jgi:peptide/nickel transport system permease protein